MTNVKMTKFHHVSLAVNDAEKVMETCTSVLGVGPWSSIDLSGTDPKGCPWKAKEYQASVGDVVIEIIQPVEGRIVQLRFLDEGGPACTMWLYPSWKKPSRHSKKKALS